jgi:excinuclease ABC subunit C
MLDHRGELIYVGKAKCLRARLMSYFRKKSRDPKAGRIIDRTRTILWESAPHEFAALIRELELIRRFRPRFNVVGMPGRQRYGYLCIGRQPAPYAFTTREPTGKELHIYGPIIGMHRANQAARRINDAFLLRDCSQRQTMYFSDQKELFPIERSAGCLRHEISTCLGPCVGACSRNQYHSKIRAAKAFLEGKELGLLHDLEKHMQLASDSLQFERATALRDKLQDLQWITDRLGSLREARDQHTFVYPLTATDDNIIWYLIDRGRVRTALYAPKTKVERRVVAGIIQEVFGGKADRGLLPKGQVDSVILVAAWFRKFPDQRDLLMSKEKALALCGH